MMNVNQSGFTGSFFSKSVCYSSSLKKSPQNFICQYCYAKYIVKENVAGYLAQYRRVMDKYYEVKENYKLSNLELAQEENRQ